jgi:Methyltransferase domain
MSVVETTEDAIAFLEKYRTGPFLEIQGWLDPQFFDVLIAVKKAQNLTGACGGAMEIGVHHGRFFIPLNGMIDDASRSFAVDLFEDQKFNVDKSGVGSRQHFQENLLKFDRHRGANVEIIKRDSIHADLSIFNGQKPILKLISIDGGHTAEQTISDLRFCSSVLSPLGILFIDDILNGHWLGVIDGVTTFLRGRPTLWPLMIGHNKLVMCYMSVHEEYRKLLEAHLKFVKTTQLCGYDILAV